MSYEIICKVMDANNDVAGHVICALPFVPPIGIFLDVDGNNREVKEVYYHLDDGSIEVYLEYLEPDSAAGLKSWGWTLGDKL